MPKLARPLRRLPLAAVLAAVAAPSAPAQCPEWERGHTRTGVPGFVYDQLDLSAAGTTRFVIGGQFSSVAGRPANNFAVWDGTTWTGVGDGPSGRVLAVAEYDDGTGPAYFAGGIGFLERFDGAQWVDVGLHLGGQRRVLALHVHDDGSGPALYVGGWFDDASIPANGLARYDGALGPVAGGGITASSGITYVAALTTHDAGVGTALFVGGRFNALGGVPAAALAGWNGATFGAVGGPVLHTAGAPGAVEALASYTPPGGVPELHLGGQFMTAGGVAAQGWAALQSGTFVGLGGPRRITDFAVRRRAGVSELHAGSQSDVQRYDGAQVTALPLASPGEVLSLGAVGSGVTQELFIGNANYLYGSSQSTYGRLEGSSWVTAFPGTGLPGPALSLASFDLGAGQELVTASNAYIAYPQLMARYDGAGWSPLGVFPGFGSSFPNPLEGGPFHVHDGELYVANLSAGQYEHPAARFDGSGWDRLAPGVFSWQGFRFLALASYDGGAGSELVVGGRFDDLGGAGTRDLARWDGTQWLDLGGGTTGGAGPSTVTSLAAWDDGAGAALFAAGAFDVLGGVAVRNVGRWDGGAWTALGAGLEALAPGAGEPPVAALVVFDSPTGEQLVATGTFDLAGGAPARNIAAWDGVAWQPLGAGLDLVGGLARGLELAVHDPDGRGERLYVAGTFDVAGGLPATGLAAWDGASWSVPAAVEPPHTVRALVSAELDGDRRLFAGGSFHTVGGVPANGFAVLADPCGAVVGLPECTSRVNSTGRRAVIAAAGAASLAADDLTLVASHLPPNHAALLASGTLPTRVTLGDGYLCVAGSIFRLLPVVSTSSAGVATQAYDFAAPYAASALPGVTLRFQCIFRDPAGGPAAFNTSNAIAVTLVP